MTVQEFVKRYDGYATQNLKDNFLKDNLEIKRYVGIATKKAAVKNIATVTTFKVDNDGKLTDDVQIDAINRYMFFNLNLINLYTNLEVDFNNAVKEFDSLAELDLFNKIFAMIPEQEVKEMTAFLNMACDDILQNKLSVQAFISEQVERFGTLANLTISPILGMLEEKIRKFDFTDEQINTVKELAAQNQ